MPTATDSSNAAAPRVPAWKRLGLKLKSAREIPEQTAPAAIVESPLKIEDPKRKRTNGAADDSPSKKLKKSARTSSPNPTSKTSVILEDPVTPKLARKKSVTFTPETKADDGDSIKQLFDTWLAEQKARDPSFLLKMSSPAFNTPEPPCVEEQIDTTLDESERRVKRVKKPKPEKVEGAKKVLRLKKAKPSQVVKSTNPTVRPFLAYLRQYHESRETWKFNKNHQNQLLKHAFNLEIIPSDYAHLLYEYVRGLQGGVRTRLRDSALSIKVKDQEDGIAGFPDNMSDAEKKQREYNSAMSEYVATMTAAGITSQTGYEEGVLLGLSDSAMANRAAKRMRSEQILAELGTSHGEREIGGTGDVENENGDDDSQKRLRMNDGTVQKVGRKRKQRTMAVDDDTSSSEESSDSDDTSSDESATEDAAADDTSSSSSSSSSDPEAEEESEDDSEDESGESDSN